MRKLYKCKCGQGFLTKKDYATHKRSCAVLRGERFMWGPGSIEIVKPEE